jgi:diguanylate cyclase (GGDEF)-like protein/PAS domain S-box-containing protein
MNSSSTALTSRVTTGQLVECIRRLPISDGLAIEEPLAVLDRYGIVNFSTQAMGILLKRPPGDIDGRAIGSILPGLPLNISTPGYNLAFAKFWGDNNQPLRLNAHFGNTNYLDFLLLLNTLSVDGTPFILLRLFPGNKQARPGRELSHLIENAESKEESVMITDTMGIIRAVNAAFEKTTGYSRDEAIGKPANLLKSGLHDQAFYQSMWETLLAGKDFRALFVNRKKNGEIFHEDKHIRPFIDGSETITHFVATSHWLSDGLRSTLLRLQHEAYHDALTGLPNRYLFEDRLKQAFSHAARRGDCFSLVYVDLDHFKEINDTYGHEVGDAVLKTTAARLRDCVRDEDTVARLGGDEFALIILDVHARHDVETVLDKILKTLNKGTRLAERQIPIQASLGADICPIDGIDSKSLINRADSAMYKAKSKGGHCFQFYDNQLIDCRNAK